MYITGNYTVRVCANSRSLYCSHLTIVYVYTASMGGICTFIGFKCKTHRQLLTYVSTGACTYSRQSYMYINNLHGVQLLERSQLKHVQHNQNFILRNHRTSILLYMKHSLRRIQSWTYNTNMNASPYQGTLSIRFLVNEVFFCKKLYRYILYRSRFICFLPNHHVPEQSIFMDGTRGLEPVHGSSIMRAHYHKIVCRYICTAHVVLQLIINPYLQIFSSVYKVSSKYKSAKHVSLDHQKL